MKAHSPFHLRSLHLTPRISCRWFWHVIPILLLLKMLACPELTSLRAQPPDVQTTGQSETPDTNFQFKIDPRTPLKDLLPPPPKIKRWREPLRGNDLSRVPEVQFQASLGVVNEAAIRKIAHQIAKINHLNNRKTDGFIESLRSERPDLAGLPFAMGDACRSKGERSRQFAEEVRVLRVVLEQGKDQLEPVLSRSFWAQYQTNCTASDIVQSKVRREQREMMTLARIAALTQILAPMAEMHPGLAKYLATISHVEATRALARLALFSSEADARKAAVDALKIRRERDYTEILVSGLRYPWPAVARRSAEAIVKLERNDLLPQLLDVLEQPDPRAPVMRQVKEKRVPMVREMVRINHHRSCLLCHAPGNTGKVSGDAVKAEVPVPGQPLNPPTGPYNASRQEILVRVDVTYLRQDFSALQAVADANPWPEMQRFDFLVRTRELTEDEAEAYREKLKPREPGEFSPYQRAALSALRELTGRDTEPTPQAWRRLLKLPADSPRKTATP